MSGWPEPDEVRIRPPLVWDELKVKLVTERVTLTPHEAAEVLGIGVSTLSDWTQAGFVPSIKRGKLRLYSVRALERWADEASRYEEAGRGKAAMGHGESLPQEWGRPVGRSGQRSPTPLRKDRTGGAADAR